MSCAAINLTTECHSSLVATHLSLVRLSFALLTSVFADADIDAAVAGALICKFRSSGQTCVCANRLFIQYVHRLRVTDISESVYDDFVSKLTKAVGNFKVGDGSSAGV